MAQQILDRPQIRPGLKQMRRERVPQRMTRHMLLNPRRRCRPRDRVVVNLAVNMVPPPDPGRRLRPGLLRRGAHAPPRVVSGALAGNRKQKETKRSNRKQKGPKTKRSVPEKRRLAENKQKGPSLRNAPIGSDNLIPKKTWKRFSVLWDETELPVPPSLYERFYDPNIDVNALKHRNLVFVVDPLGEWIQVIMNGSDGGGAYLAGWELRRDGKHKQIDPSTLFQPPS